jgi:hypothetical protein
VEQLRKDVARAAHRTMWSEPGTNERKEGGAGGRGGGGG